MIARLAIPFFLIVALFLLPALIALPLRWIFSRKVWRRATVALILLAWLAVGYGHFVGFGQLRVRNITFESSQLPKAFDGYKIVQFSDAHVGTFSGRRKALLERDIDSIMAQQADMIVFTGDLQNLAPSEIAEHLPQLSRLKAADGVYSVLGNHDYAIYQRIDSVAQERQCLLTQQAERKAGWRLLLNAHSIVRRDSDSLVIAGMENWGAAKRMPRRGNVAKTLRGIAPTAFVVMLQHDPTAWRSQILPKSHAQLTLSGHTHGGQFAIFGWSPVQLLYSEWGGMTCDGERAINVSTGMGGLIPFRLGMPGEIVTVTLKRKQ